VIGLDDQLTVIPEAAAPAGVGVEPEKASAVSSDRDQPEQISTGRISGS
jgi:hypothetical protein